MLALYTISWEIFIMASYVGLQTYFYSKTLGLSPRWRGWRLAMAMGSTAFLLVFIQLIGLNVSFLRSLGLLIFVIMLLYPVCFMGGKRKEQLFYGFINICLVLFSILFTTSILFPERLTRDMTQTSFQLMSLLIGTMLLINALLVFLIAHLTSEGRHYIPSKYWNGISLCFFLLCAGLLAVYTLTGILWNAQDTHLFMIVFSLSLFVIWVLMYIIFYLACRYFSKEAQARTLQMQQEMIEQYLLQKQAGDERMQMLRHDLKHSLAQWERLARNAGEVNALKTIEEYGCQLQTTSMLQVENESANALLNQKKWQCQQAGVSFVVDGAFHPQLSISNLDLCSLLGNMLDNAFQAASQTDVPAPLRKIVCKIHRQGSLLLLTVENGYGKAPVVKNGLFISSKREGSLPGIGISSIRYIVSQYGGVVDFTFENGWFTASAMLTGYKTNISREI